MFEDSSGCRPVWNECDFGGGIIAYSDQGGVSGRIPITNATTEFIGTHSYFNAFEDLYFQIQSINRNLSKAEAVELYEEISRGNFAAQSMFNPLDDFISMFTEWGQIITMVSDMYNGVSDIYSPLIYDSQGRLLYVEEGYNVITIERFFIGSGYSAVEKEYFIYDSDWQLMFNDVRAISRFVD